MKSTTSNLASVRQQFTKHRNSHFSTKFYFGPRDSEPTSTSNNEDQEDSQQQPTTFTSSIPKMNITLFGMNNFQHSSVLFSPTGNGGQSSLSGANN